MTPHNLKSLGSQYSDLWSQQTVAKDDLLGAAVQMAANVKPKTLPWKVFKAAWRYGRLTWELNAVAHKIRKQQEIEDISK